MKRKKKAVERAVATSDLEIETKMTTTSIVEKIQYNRNRESHDRRGKAPPEDKLHQANKILSLFLFLLVGCCCFLL